MIAIQRNKVTFELCFFKTEGLFKIIQLSNL